ncbi:hypothetical protein FZC74_01375 [Sutcliffiella horikoshii]|uniref:Uncharacterized protein n=1 Tax=Sutcliffiella horikoshii TaxID=79883 RepID=A0AA94WTX1_9BACI|nr:hypothetical protein FZC74_01375 [Sutcliffiella horikoshii]
MKWKARRRPREEGTGKTPQRSEEAYGPPAGKRSAWNGNQLYIKTFLSFLKAFRVNMPALKYCQIISLNL